MTKERADRLGKYLPEQAEPFNNGTEQGYRRTAIGQGAEGAYTFTEEVVYTDDGPLVRQQVTLNYRDGFVVGALLENGEIAGVEGFGEGLTDQDIAYHARDLFHGFARSEKSEVDPRM